MVRKTHIDKDNERGIMGGMNKNTLIIYRGLPASGKSTAAENWVAEDPETRIEINRDNTRNLIGIKGRIGNREQEELVTKINNTILEDAFSSHKDIVVSDTNLRAKNVKELIKKAKNANYNVEIKDFNNIDVEELIRRDSLRDNGVGEEVLRDMWNRFPYSKWMSLKELEKSIDSTGNKDTRQPYKNNPDLPHGVLVDIDGTLAHHENIRDPYDFSRVSEDIPDNTVIDVVNMLYGAGKRIIVMSGRSDSCKADTIAWLKTHGVKFHEMHMRRNGDTRADWLIKDELVRDFIEDNYFIEFCLDDRNQVVDHHREMGYKVFQVQPGDF